METQGQTSGEGKDIIMLVLEEISNDVHGLGQNVNDLIKAVNASSGKLDVLTKERAAKVITRPATGIDSEILLKAVKDMTARLDSVQSMQERVARPRHFDFRSKGFIIGIFVLLLVTALSTGLSLSLWSSNQLLHASAVKYRMIRQAYPRAAAWADSFYFEHPDEAERLTQQLEEKQKSDVIPAKKKIPISSKKQIHF